MVTTPKQLVLHGFGFMYRLWRTAKH